jgi:excisionase family DNA binding protein
MCPDEHAATALRRIEMSHGSESKWISGTEAARRMGCPYPHLYRLVAAGLLTRFQIPGCHPKYNADEIERLIERSTAHATRQDWDE